MIEVLTFPIGEYGANCYVVINGNKAIMIDPGNSSRRVSEMLKNKEVSLEAILLTHGHSDHVEGVKFFQNIFNCNAYISELDEIMLKDSKFNCSLMNDKSIYDFKYDFLSPKMNFADMEIYVYDTPGHTNGSVIIQIQNFLFTGDTLFQGSIGRCDLPTGSDNKMKQSLSFIKTLDPDLTIFPGHGNKSTLNEELKYNPYLN